MLLEKLHQQSKPHCEGEFVKTFMLSELSSVVRHSSVASPKFWEGPKQFGEDKMFDFRRITRFCLGYRVSKHKMTAASKHTGGHGP